MMQEDAMDENDRTVVVIPTKNVTKDAQFLTQRFAVSTQEEASSNHTLLVGDDVVFFLLDAAPPTTVCWATTTINTIEGSNNWQCVELPGGSKLIQYHTTALQTAPSRAQFASFLSNPVRTRPTLFPSLQTTLTLNNDEEFPLNARAPVAFENDLFCGQLLVVVKPTTTTTDPYWNDRIFSKYKRRLVINLQGHFKRAPKQLFAGAQVSEPMKLGLLTRGLCAVLLGIVERFNQNMHSSFGNDSEYAHICAPAHTFFERLIVTEPNEVPPDITDIINEPEDSIRQRQKAERYQFEMNKTYTFSFFTMYIDLPTWKIVGLPATNDMNLHTFWGESLLRIVMYEKTNDNDRHLKDSLNYVFCLTTKYLGEPSTADTLLQLSSRRPTVAPPGTMDRSESMLFDPSENDTEQDNLEFFDAEETYAVDEIADDKDQSDRLLQQIDALCPCWIDIYRGNGVHLKAFCVNVNKATTFRLEQACEDLVGDKLKPIIKEHFSPRLARSEKLRRSIGLSLSLDFKTPLRASKIQDFCDLQSVLDQEVLRRPPPANLKYVISNTIVSGYVARALSDRQWIEEFCCIPAHGRSIQFFHNPDKRNASFHISTSSIRTVKKMDPLEAPSLFGYPVLVLTTLGRSYYLMFVSESVLERWADVVEGLLSTPPPEEGGSISSLDTNSSSLFEIDYPADEFLHQSSMWSGKGRRLLNCSKYSFRLQPDLKPLLVAEDALTRALSIDTNDNTEEQRRLFLERTADLKGVSLNGLNEDSKLAFFLNVYHLMISHAYLVLGPPDSSLKWITYFNNIAYQVGDEIFSLSELEHSIIRAEMSYPAQFLSRFVIPKSKFAMALKKQDFRINFALNCGSLSNPSRILVYKPDELNEQLDEASRLYLNIVTTRTSSSGDIELTMPRICQWFADDFGASRETLLKKVERYLPNNVQTQIEECRRSSKKQSCDMRFLPYNFECRALTL